MKAKIKTLLLSLVIISSAIYIAGCKKNSTTPLLLGTWHGIWHEVDYFNSIGQVDSESFVTYTPGQYSITFASTGMWTSSSGSGTYTYGGDSLTLLGSLPNPSGELFRINIISKDTLWTQGYVKVDTLYQMWTDLYTR